MLMSDKKLRHIITVCRSVRLTSEAMLWVGALVLSAILLQTAMFLGLVDLLGLVSLHNAKQR